MRNISVSVKERLKKFSQENQLEFNKLAIRYVQERFLYRLSLSSYRESFILKGALLLVFNRIKTARPTSDIDFLGISYPDDFSELIVIFQEICSIPYNDGVSFHQDRIIRNEIKKGDKNNGIRMKIPWNIGTMKGALQIDIGFGDEIFPAAIPITFSSLLDFPKPKILGYSKETMLAEKVQIITSLNFETSRMKDFYDIFYLCQTNTFSSDRILSALKLTFSNRRTSLKKIYVVFSYEFKMNDHFKIQWKSFLKRNDISTSITFKNLIEKLERFFMPLLQTSFSGRWNCEKWVWEFEGNKEENW